MRRARIHWGRVLLAIVLLGASVAMQVYSARVDAQVPDDPTAVSLSGGGEDLETAFDLWAPTLGSDVTVDAGRTGSVAGRANFAAGDADFSVSSLPFTASDLSAFQQRGATAIEAPLAVTGMAFTYGTRNGSPMEQSLEDPFADPDTIPPPPTPNYQPVPKPIHIPAGVVARTVLNQQSAPLERDPDYVAETTPWFLRPQSDHPFGIVRSDSDATNHHLLEFARRNAASVPTLTTPVTPAEIWPLGYGTSTKQGEDQIARSVLDRKIDTAAAIGTVPIIAGMSPSRTNQTLLTSAEPGRLTPSALYPIAVKNGVGEWVTATSDSLTRAAAGAVAAAGSDRPAALWGLSETSPDVQGAYPVSWIVNMQLPTSGLSASKTTALATLLRYATSATGQTAAAGAGYGHLPDALVLRAAVAADQVVTSNCTGSDRKLVVASDGGRYWPDGVPVPPSGFKVCEPIPGATTATTTPSGNNGSGGSSSGGSSSGRSSSSSGSGYSSGGSSSGYSSSGADYDSSYSDVAGESEFADGGSSSGSAEGGGPGDQVDAVAVSATLPLPLPDDGRKTLDRLATMVLGGAAFLVLRGAFRTRTVRS